MRDPAKHVWASGDFYDVVTRRTESGEVGFLVCPTVEFGREPPATCLPYSAVELLEVVSAGTEILPAEGPLLKLQRGAARPLRQSRREPPATLPLQHLRTLE